MEQVDLDEKARLLFITHRARESDVQAVLADLERARRGRAGRELIRVDRPWLSAGLTYVSTRGGADGLGFADVLLRGLAADGGLFVPSAWPSCGSTTSPPTPATWRSRSG